ncbi:MAG TPA: response regulator, partial [Anaerolineae bacterium]|nr:response regulator [Anaerolineae bacterium]
MPTLEGSRAFLSTAQARVLVVDDERRLRSALVSSLSLLGYQVDQAASGQQALEMLRQRSYDLMLLDIRMPGMDGIEVMHRVRQVCPGLVIIVLTGHASLESAITAVKCDAADYLLKPIGLSALADAVANA